MMEQLSFFAEAGQSRGLPKELLEYYPGFIDEQTSSYLLKKFIKETLRSFDIRNKANHEEHYSVKLEHGSFLLMKAGLQEHWEHRIAKSTKPMKARVNLTFRMVI